MHSWQDIVVTMLRERLSPSAAYVFGSMASGRARDDSDLDLAVLVSEPVPVDDLYAVAADLSAQVGRPVDLIDFVTAPPPLQAEILRNGTLLFVDDEHQRATIVMLALGKYQRLNEEREPILKARLGEAGWKRLS